MDAYEQEEAFVRHFIVADKQERYLQFLSKPKTRGKFLAELYHGLALKGALAMELPPAKRTAVEVQQRLQRLGAKDMAYVISPYAPNATAIFSRFWCQWGRQLDVRHYNRSRAKDDQRDQGRCQKHERYPRKTNYLAAY